jgi:hypothetical protein
MVGILFLILVIFGFRTIITINGKTYKIDYKGLLSKKGFNKNNRK